MRADRTTRAVTDPTDASPRSLGPRLALWGAPLAALVVLLLPGLPLDFAQRAVLATTVVTATWWLTEAVPIGAASLVPAALLPLLGALPAQRAAAAYINDLVLLFLGAFLLALGLERWNLHRRLALAVVAAVGPKPRSIVLGFMLAAGFLSMWLNNTATTLMMLPIGVAVVAAVGERPRGPGERPNGFGTALLLGIAYSSSVGGIATPVGTAPNQVYLGQFQDAFPSAPGVPFATWVLAFLPILLLYLPLGWLLLTRVLLSVDKEGTAGGEVIRRERRALGAWSAAEKRVGLVFLAAVVLWLSRSDLDLGFAFVPGWAPLFAPAGTAPELAAEWISNATIALFLGVLLFALPSGRVPGERLMDWSTANRMPWEVLLLLGGGFAIAAGFRASGLDAALGTMLAPALIGLPPVLALLLIVVAVTALTEITSNTATTQVLLPVLASAALAADLDPRMVMLPATLAASCAFMLPVATPPNAVVFSSRLVPMATMMRVGVWFNLLLIALIALVFELWSRHLIGIEASLPDWARG